MVKIIVIIKLLWSEIPTGKRCDKAEKVKIIFIFAPPRAFA